MLHERRTLNIYDRFMRTVQTHPDRLLVSDQLYGDFTYAEVASKVGRLASALLSCGVRKGDRVILQLPNWMPFLTFHLALTRIGAVTAMLPITYRVKELTEAAKLTGARALVMPVRFNGESFVETALAVRTGSAGSLQLLFADPSATDPEPPLPGSLLYEGMTGEGAHSGDGQEDGLTGPDDVTVLGFTSGTTGSLKAAMFDSHALDAINEGLKERYGLGENDRILGCSPLGHAVGFTHALRMTLYIGGSIVLMQRWDPEKALELIEERRCTFAAGATPFLMDMVRSARSRKRDLSSLRLFLCGGATIPRKLMMEAREALPHTFTSPLWGMTECGGVTTAPFDAPQDKLFETDGLPCRGMRLKIAGPDGCELPAGEEGELLVAGPMLSRGYYGQPELTLQSYLPDGFFRTGDLARLDPDGYVRITGRVKDLIIRGGVNIAPAEIEEALFGHPGVRQVAVVGEPDERLGERICAFIVPEGDRPPDLAEVQAWLQENGLAKQKWPERILALDELPMTPSRKIQKFKLRELAGKIGT